MAVVSHRREEDLPLIGALRQLRDPLLLLAFPVAFALLLMFAGYANSWPIGFDFRGTLWEPARALLEGNPVYPNPTRDAVVVGNPAVSIPAGSFDGLPVGMQVLAPHHHDALLLDLALVVERERPWPLVAPGAPR